MSNNVWMDYEIGDFLLIVDETVRGVSWGEDGISNLTDTIENLMNPENDYSIVKVVQNKKQETKDKLLARGYNLDDLDNENPYNNTGDTS